MATTEQLKSRVNLLQKSGEYYAPEDFMTAEKLMRPSEAHDETMRRLWPSKVWHSWLIEKALEQEIQLNPENAGEIQE